ncbi:MAG: LysR substrate-binding domain-containing protein [Kiloniellales bacterium]
MSSWLPSLNGLRAFEAVSRHLNYREAAEELHVSPGAAHQLVRKLEDAIGGPLLEKKGRKLVLTPVGAIGREGLSLPFRQIADTVERMRRMTGSQRFIVSTTPSFASSWLVPRLESFKQKNPGMDVLIDSTPQIVDLDFGVADVAIRFGIKDHGNLVSHRLFDETLCAFCSPQLAKGPPEITRLEDLESVMLLRWDLSQFEWAENTRKWNYWKHWLAQMGASHVTPGDGLRFSDYNLAVQAAIAGQGFIIGSIPILRELIEAKLLVNPFGRGAKTDIGYDLAVTKSALSRAEVTAFIDWIVEEAKSAMPESA